MKMLRLPSSFSLSSIPLDLDTTYDITLFFAPVEMVILTSQDRAASGTVLPSFTVLRVEMLGSPKFP
jgi:hypothetical protein